MSNPPHPATPIQLTLQAEIGDVLVNSGRVAWTREELTLLLFVLSEHERNPQRHFTLHELAERMAGPGEDLSQGADRLWITVNSITAKIRLTLGEKFVEVPDTFKFLLMSGPHSVLHPLITVTVEK